MKTNIEFILLYYHGYHCPVYNVVYKSGMIKTYFSSLPRTVKTFIENSEKEGKIRKQWDSLFKRQETIYE